MSDHARKRRWFAFSLRTLFVAVAVGGLSLWGARGFLDWYFSVPLAAEITSFNTWAAGDLVGKMEPQLTEEEVIACIQSKLPTLDASQQVKAIYGHTARTKRLPRGARLTGITGYSSSAGSPGDLVWWINLGVVTGKKSGYGMRIR